MKKRCIVLGYRLGVLTIKSDLGTRATKGNKKRTFLLVTCDCGKEKEIEVSYFFRRYHKRCTCSLETEKHGLSNTRLYKIHGGIKRRCYDKKRKDYKNYGERGITICDEWLGKNGFINFYTWAMANGYGEKLSIDRINNNGNYTPENCRWTNVSTQNINQRIKKNNTSGYKGIYFNKKLKKWSAVVSFDKKNKIIGTFNNKKDAILARNEYILKNGLPHEIQQ